MVLISSLLASCGGSDSGSGIGDVPVDLEDGLQMRQVQYLDGDTLEYFYAFEGEKTRLDYDNPHPVAMIYRGDRQLVWMLYPEFSQYQELVSEEVPDPEEPPVDYPDFPVEPPESPNPPIEVPEGECRQVGSDTIAGRSADKTLCLIEYQDYRFEYWQWTDRKTGFPLRMAYPGETDVILDTTLFDTGDVPDSLFEVPAGYVRVETSPYD
jgi:hypothetical protein